MIYFKIFIIIFWNIYLALLSDFFLSSDMVSSKKHPDTLIFTPVIHIYRRKYENLKEIHKMWL